LVGDPGWCQCFGVYVGDDGSYVHDLNLRLPTTESGHFLLGQNVHAILLFKRAQHRAILWGGENAGEW
jgi:hypothetical protein